METVIGVDMFESDSSRPFASSGDEPDALCDLMTALCVGFYENNFCFSGKTAWM